MLTCIGDAGGFHYKKSRRGNAEIDRAAAHVLRHCGESAEILEFSPYGYDERQYCSPGFNLPVGCLMRSVWGTLSGVSHFGRQPRLHSAAATGRIASCVRRHSGRARKQSVVSQPELLTVNPNWDGETSTGPRAATRSETEIHCAALGAESLRRGALSAGHRGAIWYLLLDDQRGCGSALPERAAVGRPGRWSGQEADSWRGAHARHACTVHNQRGSCLAILESNLFRAGVAHE